MICVTRKAASQRLPRAFIVLLRDTTWKCGTVERLVVNYMRRQIGNYRGTHFPVKDILEDFDVKKHQQRRFFDAIERLEKRGIIKIVFNPFSYPTEFVH
ncbi:MAG: hypothetical protein CW716_12045 [Candidatus Bathyarchaeum sp.]|nr:MAG: hypothetical protein CW716_12045 [Candidatus Bathyarchaeum sp.]